MIITSFKKKLYDMVKLIPEGKVATYGQLAWLIGSPGASRAVGNALHVNPDPEHTPCFRVVNSEGYLSGAFAFGGSEAQRELLEADGTEVKDGKVDLRRYGWIPQVIRSSKLKNTHAFSTRLGGVSTGVYRSLNLGMNTGDDPEHVRKNWKIFSDAGGFGTDRFVYGKQEHGNRVLTVCGEDAREPFEGPPDLLRADGCVTASANVPLVVFTADCVPLLLEDTGAGVIGAVHCGWRSTAADIEQEAVRAMQALGARAADIRAAIGPAIEMSCFEVGGEVVSAMEQLTGGKLGGLVRDGRPGKFYVDLKGIVKKRLVQLGVQEENIGFAGGCTICEPGRFWSHRYTKGMRGSQANVIMMKN